MSFDVNCQQDRLNIGQSEICQDLGLPIGYILTEKGVEFATEADAQDLDNWIEKIVSKDIYPSTRIKSTEDTKEDTTYDDTPTGEDFVRHGKQRWRFMHSTSSKLHTKLWSHARKGGGIFTVYENANTIRIGGYSPRNTDLTLDQIIFRPFTLELFQPEKLGTNDGTSVTTSNVYVVLRNALQYNRDIVTIEPNFEFDELNSLIDVNLVSVGSPTATSATVFVYDDNTGLPVKGLVAQDFATATGGVLTDITSLTANADGSYNLVYPTLSGANTITLKAPADMETNNPQGYEVRRQTAEFNI